MRLPHLQTVVLGEKLSYLWKMQSKTLQAYSRHQNKELSSITSEVSELIRDKINWCLVKAHPLKQFSIMDTFDNKCN